MTLLSIENLSIQFKGTNTPTVQHVNLSISSGETVALVGESGSGKSITALSIMRLLCEQIVSYPTGTITFQDKNILAMPRTGLQSLRGNRISAIFQEPMTALNPLHTIGKQLREAVLSHKKISQKDTETRITEALNDVELPHMLGRLNAYPHQLSGGERQRIMIAMAIINIPELLIADEPTTALDVHVQKSIMELLCNLQKKHNMSVLLISHDLNLVRHYASKVAIMQAGCIVEHGDVSIIFSNPSHNYTKKLLNSAPKGQALPIAQNAKTILSCSNLSVRFPQKQNWRGKTLTYKHAVNEISLQVKQGETLGIVGESGSGKTTLAQAIARLLPCTGTCEFQNNDFFKANNEEIRKQRQFIQYIFQDPFSSLNPRLTIEAIIREGLDIHEAHLSIREKTDKITSILQETGLSSDMLQRYPHEFSGGQRQRIAIARAMILNPRLVILDEPTSALDLSLQSQILDLLKRLQEKYKTSYIFITHDLHVIRAIAHRIIVMKDGKMAETGKTEQIFSSPATAYTQMLIASIQ